MFLLIQNQIILLMLKYSALNSIMFLLILLGIMKIQQEKITFKFHYVSINSTTSEALMGLQLTLNSIMFLLIHNQSLTFHQQDHPLNSIMFLLIPELQTTNHKVQLHL